jgi:hypothetical protein
MEPESRMTQTSKSQTVKITILLAVLLVVLLFNGRIKKIISDWRTRSSDEAKTRNASPSRDINLPLSGIARILHEKLIIPSLEKEQKAGQDAGLHNWPENLARDIFNFETSRKSTGDAGDASRKKRKREPPAQQNAASRLKLEATLTGGAPVAVINNQPLMIGQSIRGYKLREIRDQEAVLTKDGKDIVLKISQDLKLNAILTKE